MNYVVERLLPIFSRADLTKMVSDVKMGVGEDGGGARVRLFCEGE